MVYLSANEIKAIAVSQFDDGKLENNLQEWGFNTLYNRDMKVLAYATNLTPYTVKESMERGAQFLLTHHDAWPFIYGMKEECLKLLNEAQISHGFFHALLDDADFGTSSSLSAALGLQNVEKAVPYDEFQAGVIGYLPVAISLIELKRKLSQLLDEEIRVFANHEEMVKKICITTGGGNLTNDLKYAVDQGCDTYITGEYGLYSQLYASFSGLNLLIGSHTRTEILGVASLAKRIVAGSNIEIIEIKEPSY